MGIDLQRARYAVLGRIEAGHFVGYDEVNHKTHYTYSLVALVETVYLTLSSDTILSIAKVGNYHLSIVYCTELNRTCYLLPSYPSPSYPSPSNKHYPCKLSTSF